MQSSLRQFCTAGLLIAVISTWAFPADARRGRRVRAATTSANAATAEAFNQAMNSLVPPVQACVAQNGFSKGAHTVRVNATISVTSNGAVLAARADITADGGDAPGIRACVEQAIKAVHFPSSSAPIVNIDRSWTLTAAH